MDLFTVDNLTEIKSRLQKLDTDRTFFDTIEGGFYTSKLLFTTKLTCEHTVFDRINKSDFKCRQCSGIITNRQIIHNLNTKTK